jgi:hypothetical protein
MNYSQAGRVRRRYSLLSLPLSAALLESLQRHQEALKADELTAPPSQDATTMHVKELGMSKLEPRMTMKDIINSIPVGPRETTGKNSLDDLSVGGRPHYRASKPADEHERKLLAVFNVWMKHSTAAPPGDPR